MEIHESAIFAAHKDGRSCIRRMKNGRKLATVLIWIDVIVTLVMIAMSVNGVTETEATLAVIILGLSVLIKSVKSETVPERKKIVQAIENLAWQIGLSVEALSSREIDDLRETAQALLSDRKVELSQIQVEAKKLRIEEVSSWMSNRIHSNLDDDISNMRTSVLALEAILLQFGLIEPEKTSSAVKKAS